MEFAKFLRTPFLQNTSRQLLLLRDLFSKPFPSIIDFISPTIKIITKNVYVKHILAAGKLGSIH